EIQRPPPSTTLTKVITRCATIATPAPTARLSDWPHRDHDRLRDLIEPDLFHDVRVSPHARSHTLLFRTPPCLLDRSRRTTPNLGTGRGALADQPRHHPRIKQKSEVSVALQDGTRIDDSSLVSSGRRRARTLWLFANGEDVFVPIDDIVDVWEP